VPESTLTLLGTAAQICSLFDNKIEVDSVYGKNGSRLYHFLTLHEDAEISEIIEAAGDTSHSVLELACGSGRLTIPLLKAGFTVQGLDYSPHMLAHLSEQIGKPENAAYSDRLSVVEDDMTAFSLDRKFDVVILVASAIINVTPEQRAAMFRCVREHLTDNGRFLATILDFPALAEGGTTPFENISVFPFHNGESPLMCIFSDFIDPVERIRSTNFISNTIDQGAITDSAIYTAITYPVPLADLEEEIAAADMRLLSSTELTSGYQVLKAGKYPVRALLLEIGR
jgi:SAM-dependent methyltransferase